jgi:hypothetical protein
LGGVAGWVDPGDGRQLGWFGTSVEPFGVAGVGGGEDLGAVGADGLGGSEVDGCRGVQSEPGVVVLVVVVVEELLAERAGVLDVLEVVGEGGAVLEGLERRLAAEVVDGCREEKVSEQVAVLTPLGATVTGPRRTAS